LLDERFQTAGLEPQLQTANPALEQLLVAQGTQVRKIHAGES